MVQFNNFSVILPEPAVNWGTAGEENAVTGVAGPGFSSIKEDSVEPIMKSKFNFQKLDRTGNYFHKWTFAISYNSLLREEFDTIFAFLLHKNVTLEPFYISIPQYSSQVTTNKITDGAKSVGDNTLLLLGTGVTTGTVFSIIGFSKIYKVVRVETETDYNTNLGSIANGKERIHITPPLQQDIVDNSTLSFIYPLFRVQQLGDISYSLNAKNLYSFGLQVEEV